MSKNTDLGNLVNGLFVSSTRNVGIGTSTPANAVVVDKGTATASYLQFTAGATTGQLATDGFEVGIDASGNGIISQQENLPLMMYTNSAERLRITSAGNVGIGATNPSQLLEVNGSSETLGISMNIRNSFDGADSTKYSGINFLMGSDNGTSAIRAYRTNSAADFQTNLTFWTKGAGAGATSPTERMRITSAGNVGIGASTSPTYLLEASTAGGSQRIRVGTLQNNNNNSTFEAITTASNTTASSGWIRANAGGTMSIGTSTYAKANSDSGNFANLSSEAQTIAMTINANGNIGIGGASSVGAASDDLVLQIHNVNSTGSMRSMVRYTNFNSGNTWGNGTFMGVDSSLNFYIGNLEAAAIIYQTNNIERMRITSSGDVAIGNTSPSTKLHVTGTISSTDIIMSGGGSWSYTTNSSWTSYQVGIPFNSLAGGGVYLIRLQWGGDAPFIAYGSFLWMPVQSNGGSSDNEMVVMVSTHQGGGGLIFVRNGSVGGQASSQLLIRLANFAQYNGNLTVTAARLM